MFDPLDGAAVIVRCSRRVAIADGVLVDANRGEFAEVSSEHFPERHLAMTAAVLSLVDVALQEGADRASIWHDILRMSRVRPVRLVSGGHTFEVGIRAGRNLCPHELKVIFFGGDNGEPCAAVMLPEED